MRGDQIAHSGFIETCVAKSALGLTLGHWNSRTKQCLLRQLGPHFSTPHEPYDEVFVSHSEAAIWLMIRKKDAPRFARSLCDIEHWNERPQTPSQAGFCTTSFWNSKAI
jgi:hypothetical protein